MALDAAASVRLVEVYGDIITRVSGQVARQYAAYSGRSGHGYEVVSADDIEQAVYEQLIKSEVGAEALDAMVEPQGYIRTTARLYGAANPAKAARRATLTPFAPRNPDDDSAASLPSDDDPAFASHLGNPESELIESDFIRRVRSIVETILTRVESLSSRRVARLFYLGGLDSVAIAEALGVGQPAVRKSLQRARDEVGAEADASLRAWREFAHPDAKRPQSIDARPTALMALAS